MMEWFILVIMAGLIASVGGILHIVVPPYDADTASVLRRYGASWVVGLVLGCVLPDPSQYGFPSYQVFLYVIGLIAIGYVAIDVVIQWLQNPPTQTPEETEEPEPPSG